VVLVVVCRPHSEPWSGGRVFLSGIQVPSLRITLADLELKGFDWGVDRGIRLTTEPYYFHLFYKTLT
jgi:hypothetical protein